MAIISDKLNKILSAVFGKDVRQALHDGLDAINKETESTTDRQVHLEDTFDQLVINAGESNAEIVDARVGENGQSFNKLGDRLDNFDASLDNITQETMIGLDSKRDKNTKLTKSDFDTSNDNVKLGLNNLSEEVKNAMTGETSVNQNIADGSITTEKYADGSITRDKVNSEVINVYPFEYFADFKYQDRYIPYVKKAIKNIVLFNANPSERYFIKTLVKGAWDDKRWCIEIHKLNSDSTSTAVAVFLEKDYKKYISGVDTVKLTKWNEEGIEGYVMIDWSEFTDAGIFNLTYENTALDNRCIFINEITPRKGNYPFSDNINLNLNIPRNLIKKVELYNTDLEEKYYLSVIQKGITVHSNRVNCIRINKESDKSIVCEFNQVQTTDNNTMKLVQVNSSGIEGIIVVDWSLMVEGATLTGTEYLNSGLSDICKIIDRPNTNVDSFELFIPDEIYGVVGKEINIYYDNIIKCDNLRNVIIDVNSPIGQQQEERWVYVPTSAGNFTVSVSLYKNGVLVISKTTNIIICEANKGEGQGNNISYMQIGDSLTDYEHFPNEIKKLFSEDSVGNINMVGTRGTNAKHEGRAGWTSDNYINDSVVGDKANAFYNPSSKTFDFSYYMTSNSFTSITHVTIALGTNDVAQNKTSTINNLKTMITSILSYNPNCKIGICYLIPSSKSQDGWGKLNGCGEYSKNHFNKTFELNKTLQNEFLNFNSNVYLIPVNTNLNRVYGFPTEDVQVDSRNTQIIKRGIENVHPSETGFYQMSDSVYYFIKNIL